MYYPRRKKYSLSKQLEKLVEQERQRKPMLYVGFCKNCDYIVSASDITLFKQSCATHLKQHKIDFGCFVANISLKDFSDVFRIKRMTKEKVIRTLKALLKNPKYYDFYRNSNKFAQQLAEENPSIFMTSTSREFKPLCKLTAHRLLGE